MRFPLSLAVAVAMHGVLFGVAGAVLAHRASAPLAPATVELEVEVVAPKPDPIAEALPAAPVPPVRATPATLRRSRSSAPRREVAPVDDTVATEPSEVAEPVAPIGPAVSAPPAPGPPVLARPYAASSAASSAAPSVEKIVSATPRYRVNPPPDYPLPCRHRHEEGTVLVDVVVRQSGLPSTISLHQSSGHPLLDRAALEAVRGWSFEPARAAGVPVASSVVVPVRFSLSEQQ